MTLTHHVQSCSQLVQALKRRCSAPNGNIRALDRDDPQYGFGLVQAKAALNRISALGCDN